MTVFDKMKIEFLQGLKAAGEEVQHFRVPKLASEYAIKEGYVRERLVEWHNDKLIRLSAFHETGAVKPLEEWPDPEYFFDYASDGNYKRVRRLARGAEFLQQSQAEAATPNHAIGFHS